MDGTSRKTQGPVTHLKRWSLVSIGAIAIVFSIGSYAIEQDAGIFDALVALLPSLVGLWIVVTGYRVARSDMEPNRVWKLTRRALLGAAVAGFGTVGIILLLALTLVGPDMAQLLFENVLELNTSFLGQLVIIDVLLATIIGEGGGLLIGIYEDRMEHRTRELERANERLDEFAGVVTHDLRNPLTVADLNMHLAHETGDEKYFDAVDRAHSRMEAIIEDVLTLARNSGELTALEPVDISQVAQDAWETTDTRDGTFDVTVTGLVTADPARLRTLFENLFRNALDHGGPTTHVVVGNLQGGGFFVADDGPGIAVAERDHVFDAGYTTSDNGTGFGLAIVKRIADAHGWSVRVSENPAGRGAQFEFRR
ncbi:sensor histidine kinase [Haloarchaeobius sp. TZWSO28]|uniref:sensor histidine kinase n=1 Tax=Haloarchaeobius sp. TZWSO28 TaxID=3446119 RepID=UPI003EBCBD45